MVQKEAVSESRLLTLSSEDLTLQFFLDLVGVQAGKLEAGKKDRGELLVSVAHNKEKAGLEVLVIQGRGLPAMDKDGE